jgi:hypothetical protein
MAMVCLSRDRNCQRRDGVVSPSPGRRRLRFSFQINDVKDPTGASDPTDDARRREERRL